MYRFPPRATTSKGLPIGTASPLSPGTGSARLYAPMSATVCSLPSAEIRETRAFVPIGPVPPKFTGSGTMTSPGLPASATYNTPSGPKTIPFGFTSPTAYTSTWVADCAETGATHRAATTNRSDQRYTVWQRYRTYPKTGTQRVDARNQVLTRRARAGYSGAP